MRNVRWFLPSLASPLQGRRRVLVMPVLGKHGQRQSLHAMAKRAKTRYGVLAGVIRSHAGLIGAVVANRINRSSLALKPSIASARAKISLSCHRAPMPHQG